MAKLSTSNPLRPWVFVNAIGALVYTFISLAFGCFLLAQLRRGLHMLVLSVCVF